VVRTALKGKTMFIFTWLFDKIGYMPKVTVDTSWPFPTANEVAPKATTVAQKPTVKKATTRKKKA
jgi:hypothetical protein